jgi:hypothetical protein
MTPRMQRGEHLPAGAPAGRRERPVGSGGGGKGGGGGGERESERERERAREREVLGSGTVVHNGVQCPAFTGSP